MRQRTDRAYKDKLDGKISEEFWQRNRDEWHAEKVRLESRISDTDSSKSGARLLDAQRIIELAKSAYSLYLMRNPSEKAELLKKVLLNCRIDGVSLYPAYRKPFDMICKRVKSEEWSGRADLNCRPLAPQASALPG